MIREIPYMLYFIANRSIRTPDKGRLWFERLETPALLALESNSKVKAINYTQELIEEIFRQIHLNKRDGLKHPILKYSSRMLKILIADYFNVSYNSPHQLTKILKQEGLQPSKHATTFEYCCIDVKTRSDWKTEIKKDTGHYFTFHIWDYLSYQELSSLFTKQELDAKIPANILEKLQGKEQVVQTKLVL